MRFRFDVGHLAEHGDESRRTAPIPTLGEIFCRQERGHLLRHCGTPSFSATSPSRRWIDAGKRRLNAPIILLQSSARTPVDSRRERRTAQGPRSPCGCAIYGTEKQAALSAEVWPVRMSLGRCRRTRVRRDRAPRGLHKRCSRPAGWSVDRCRSRARGSARRTSRPRSRTVARSGSNTPRVRPAHREAAGP